MCDWTESTKKKLRTLALLPGAVSIGLMAILPARGETTTGLVGFNEIVCRGGSDTMVSVAFHQKPLLRAGLVAAPVVNGTKATLRFDNAASLPPGDLTGTHYVRFRAGSPLQGRIYPVSGNGADSVTVDREGVSFAGVSAGAGVELVPMWTLETLLPRASQQTMHVSGGNLRPVRRSELLIFNPAARGENIVPARVFFLTNFGWREAKAGYPTSDDTVISPGTALVVRHQSGDGDTTFRTSGRAISGQWVTRLPSETGGNQEFPAGVPVAEDLTLDELQLDNGNAFVESLNTSAQGRRDELRVYDAGGSGPNPEPSAVYFRAGGEWLEDKTGFPAAGNDVIPAGAGIVILKAPRGGANGRWVFDTGF